LDATLTTHRRLYQRTLERYDFRVATPADTDGIVALWPEHWEEAHYKDRGIVPCEERYRAWTEKVLTYGVQIMLVALDGPTIIGFFAYSLDHNFSVDPVAVMGTFYVRKEHRRSAVAAILMDLAIGSAKGDGACAFHAPITSETLSSRALENMMRHQGFNAIGTMMGRAL
jgi:L-amino acid N-acyltransferase YncA